MLSDNDIRRIVARIVEASQPLLVATVGSYAIGTAHAGSDLDLLVIQPSVLPRQARAAPMRRLLSDVLHPLDLLVFTPEEFATEAADPLSFAWVIAQQARVWHVQPDIAGRLPALRSVIEAAAPKLREGC